MMENKVILARPKLDELDLIDECISASDQTLKIMKRPQSEEDKDVDLPIKNLDLNNHIKSYEEREAEYNKARQRILGSTVSDVVSMPPASVMPTWSPPHNQAVYPAGGPVYPHPSYPCNVPIGPSLAYPPAPPPHLLPVNPCDVNLPAEMYLYGGATPLNGPPMQYMMPPRANYFSQTPPPLLYSPITPMERPVAIKHVKGNPSISFTQQKSNLDDKIKSQEGKKSTKKAETKKANPNSSNISPKHAESSAKSDDEEDDQLSFDSKNGNLVVDLKDAINVSKQNKKSRKKKLAQSTGAVVQNLLKKSEQNGENESTNGVDIENDVDKDSLLTELTPMILDKDVTAKPKKKKNKKKRTAIQPKTTELPKIFVAPTRDINKHNNSRILRIPRGPDGTKGFTLLRQNVQLA